MILTQQQRSAAQALLTSRPAVVPGTCAIINREEQIAWHQRVYAEAERVGATSDQHRMKIFCDVAGVAD
jgi:hypothetical protein